MADVPPAPTNPYVFSLRTDKTIKMSLESGILVIRNDLEEDDQAYNSTLSLRVLKGPFENLTLFYLKT
ncbi:hypothetical protein M0804_008804 [Polistes exclamans]|nr:hypothetical protein M0804_008804 [Polistes exclamans]